MVEVPRRSPRPGSRSLLMRTWKVSYAHDDAIVITTIIDNARIPRSLVDTESSCDILFMSSFEQMKIGQRKLEDPMRPLYGFTNHIAPLAGTIDLPMAVVDGLSQPESHHAHDQVLSSQRWGPLITE